jgi:hypothetical protein
MGFQRLHAVVYAHQITRLMMILGDALILTSTPCDKRHFVYDERVSDENIIAVLHDEGNGIVVDIAPRAKDISLQQSYESLFEAFYHLDEQVAALAA